MRPIVTDRVAWSVCHTSEPCKNWWTDRDAVCVEDSGGSREPHPPMGRGSYEGGKGRPIVKYRDSLRSSLQRRLNRLRCPLARNHVLDGVHTYSGTTGTLPCKFINDALCLFVLLFCYIFSIWLLFICRILDSLSSTLWLSSRIREPI